MKTSDEIFLLLKSLSKQEKSYFKKFASAFTDEESNNYIKLYDEIAGQVNKENQYDEEKIKAGNYSGKFLKNLSFHKNYLYNMILSSLTQYQKDARDMIPIRNLISQAEILFDKLLIEQSLKVLLRAKKLSIDKDKFNYLFEILSLERQIYKNLFNNEELTEKANSLFTEQYQTLDIMKNSLDYYFLNDKIGNHLRKMGTGRIRNEKESQDLKEYFDNPLLRDINNAKSFFSKTLFNTINLQNSLNNYDYERGYIFIKNNVELWENNLNKAGGKLDNYIYSINNLINCQLRLKRFSECESTLDKLKQIEKKFPRQITEKNKVFIFYSLTVMSITKHLATIDKGGLEETNADVGKNANMFEFKIQLSQRIIFYYFLGISNFVLGDYDKCIYWMGKIINLEKSDLSQDYQCYARIVYLISYYELNYLDSLEYALKSAYHFISKKERVYKYENIILKYLRRSFKIKSHQELNDMFKEMKFEMEKIFDDPFEQNAFDAFNILPWLESKIKNESMLDILKKEKIDKQENDAKE